MLSVYSIKVKDMWTIMLYAWAATAVVGVIMICSPVKKIDEKGLQKSLLRGQKKESKKLRV